MRWCELSSVGGDIVIIILSLLSFQPMDIIWNILVCKVTHPGVHPGLLFVAKVSTVAVIGCALGQFSSGGEDDACILMENLDRWEIVELQERKETEHYR